MTPQPSLDDLWNSTLPGTRSFRPGDVPEPARRYLAHAIAAGTLLPSAARLRMHGEIRLQRWRPFTADEVIRKGKMIWKATVRLFGLPVFGSDRFVAGEGRLQWKLLGIVPVTAGSGPDVTRSTAGRLHAESIWLPSLLCDAGWTAVDAWHLRARFEGAEDLELTIDDHGSLRTFSMKRWGNPDGGAFRPSPFGGMVEAEGTFAGITIPTRMRLGWFFGSERFESEGEFFGVTVDEAKFR